MLWDNDPQNILFLKNLSVLQSDPSPGFLPTALPDSLSETLGIPYFPFMLLLAVGVGMLCLIFLTDFLQCLRRAAAALGSTIYVFVVIGLGLVAWSLTGVAELDRAFVGLIGIAVLTILLFLGVHIGFALVMVGFAGFSLVGGIGLALSNTPIVTFK